MATFLILKLQGPMQAWGGHTYEDYRPTDLFPTRSGLVGLLGACLGVDRHDLDRQRSLSESFTFAVRDDAGSRARVVTDYHTILKARQVDGNPRKTPVESRREYLCDAAFTVALRFRDGAEFGLDRVLSGIARPRYTPFLGRRSCPLARPLFEKTAEAEDLLAALATVAPIGGTVYSEERSESSNVLALRDVPLPGRVRQFGVREVYVHAAGG